MGSSSVGTIKIGMSVQTGQLSKGLKNARGQLTGFSGVLTRVSVSVGAARQSIIGSLSQIGLAVEGLRAIYNTVSAVVATPLQLAAELESTTIAFNTLTGSTEIAAATLAELREFGASTPFTFAEDIAPSAKKLLAFGIDAKDVTGELRKLGDISAGLGVPLNQLSEMFGKAKVSGRLFGEDINQWSGAGVPLIQELAQQFGVTEAQVKELVSKGKVNFTHLQTAINSLTMEGGKFGGLMKAQSTSIGGLWSTLVDNFTVGLTEIGTGLIEAFNLKWVVGQLTGFVASSIPVIQAFSRNLSETMSGFAPVFIETWNVISAGFTMLSESLGGLFAEIGSLMGGFLPSFSTFTQAVVAGLVAVEFGFTNWRKMSSLAVLSVLAEAIGFGGAIGHLFTTVIPAYMSYLGENWWNILSEIGRAGELVFGNFANNIVAVLSNLPALIRGQVSLNDLWTPLTDDMAFEFAQMEAIPERVMGDLERTLREDVSRMSDELGTGFDELLAQRMGELFTAPGVTDVVAESGKQLAQQVESGIQQGVKSSGELKLADAAIAGSQEARSSILRNSLSVPNAQKELANIGKEQLAVQREQLRVLRRNQNEVVGV
ncbi:MAG: tape measure protein [Planctomycetaceae bacterium]